MIEQHVFFHGFNKPTSQTQYIDYTAKMRAQIGKYAAENGPTKTARHFSKKLGRNVPGDVCAKNRQN